MRPWRFDTPSCVASASPLSAQLRGQPVVAAWDPDLGDAIARHGVRVEEEGVLSYLLVDLRGRACYVDCDLCRRRGCRRCTQWRARGYSSSRWVPRRLGLSGWSLRRALGWAAGHRRTSKTAGDWIWWSVRRSTSAFGGVKCVEPSLGCQKCAMIVASPQGWQNFDIVIPRDSAYCKGPRILTGPRLQSWNSQDMSEQ